MKRIAIFGSPGSGKSTLARRLSCLTDLPVIHLDQHYFYPGWVIKPTIEFRMILTSLVAADRWITDGNYTTESGASGRIERADTLILLDCPRLLCLWRVFWRAVRNYNQVRPDQADGCPERFDWEFLTFVWNFPAKTERIRTMMSGFADQKAVYFLKDTADVRQFLAQVSTAQTTHLQL